MYAISSDSWISSTSSHVALLLFVALLDPMKRVELRALIQHSNLHKILSAIGLVLMNYCCPCQRKKHAKW
jgi:hypothetical protein